MKVFTKIVGSLNRSLSDNKSFIYNSIEQSSINTNDWYSKKTIKKCFSNNINSNNISNSNNNSQYDNQGFNAPIKSSFDYTKHSLHKHLYLFKFNNDNIGYVLHDPKTKSLLGFDFGEYQISSKIVSQLEKNLNARFKYLFTTHSHNDHCGGNEEWKLNRQNDLTIICGEYEDVKNNDFVKVHDKKMKDLETISIGDLCIACMHTPGHLKSHVVYVVTHVTSDSTKIPFLFCGDTLFAGSVGKVFNGTYEELYNSIKKIFYLPNDTLFYCGHEYTVNNLKFNLKLDPENEFLKDKLEWAQKTVDKGDFTVGSRLVEERIYNAFVRAGDPYYLNLTGEQSPLRSFIKLRKLKDEMKI